MSWNPLNRVTRPVYDSDDEDLIRYEALGKFWGGGRLLKSNAWDDLCNFFHLPVWMQQDLLDHIEKKWPGTDVESLNFGELREYCRECFEYDKELGAVYKKGTVCN